MQTLGTKVSELKQSKRLFKKQDKSLKLLICKWQVAFVQKLRPCNYV